MHRRPKYKIPIRIAPARWKQIRFRGSDDHVRLAKLPARAKSRLRRKIRWIAFDLALVHPSLNRRDFRVRQTKLVRKFQFARFWKPRRHDVFACDERNLTPVRFYVLIGKQRERSRLAR